MVDREIQPEYIWNDGKKEVVKKVILAHKNRFPCNFDHNGECLICNTTYELCAYDRWKNKDYKYETEEELNEMFKEYDN